MNKIIMFCLLLTLSFIHCSPQKPQLDSITENIIINNDNTKLKSESNNVQTTIFEYEDFIELSFNMDKEQIQKYYKTIDELVKKNDTTEFIFLEAGALLTESELEDIKNKRLFSTEIFENDLVIQRSENYKIIYYKTPILPNGYINFDNYEYRINFPGMPRNSYTDNLNNFINPLQSSPGFIILKNDINVYHSDDGLMKGLLKSGTVFRIEYMSLENKVSLNTHSLNEYFIKIEDIEEIYNLIKEVNYKIIGNKVYRFIKDLKIEINVPIHYLEDGTSYIRRENPFENGVFYFWEYWCDYFFDIDGNFIEYGFGPNYGR